MIMETEADRHEQISVLLEVEGDIVFLMRQLHDGAPITYKEANERFTDVHVNAAWTDLTPLANLADTIWSELDGAEPEEPLSDDHRVSFRKHLITYKFLLSRLMGDYQPEIDAAMAS